MMNSSTPPIIKHRTIRCDDEGNKFLVTDDGQPDKPLSRKKVVAPIETEPNKTRRTTGKDILWNKLKETAVDMNDDKHLRNLAVANVWDGLTDLERRFLASKAGEDLYDQDTEIDLRLYRREIMTNHNVDSNPSDSPVETTEGNAGQSVIEQVENVAKAESDNSLENLEEASEQEIRHGFQTPIQLATTYPSNSLLMTLEWIRRRFAQTLPADDALFQLLELRNSSLSPPPLAPTPATFMQAIDNVIRLVTQNVAQQSLVVPTEGRLDQLMNNDTIQALLVQLRQGNHDVQEALPGLNLLFQQSTAAIPRALSTIQQRMSRSEQQTVRQVQSESENSSDVLSPEVKESKNTYTFQSPKVLVKNLPSGGVLRVFPGLLDEVMRENVCREMNSVVKYRQYTVNGGDEPRIHSLYHKDAICTGSSCATDDLHDSSCKATPGYKYAGIRMKSRPLSELPEISQLAEGLKSVSEVEEWNVGVNTLIYRDGNDRIGKHSDDDQGEEKIMTVIISSPPEPRRVLIEEKKLLPGTQGEQIELLLNAGDAYEMDAEMQKHYIHSVPKKAKDVGFGYQRAVIVLRSGKTEYVSKDSGRPVSCLSPPPKVENYRFGPFPSLKYGDELPRSDMLRLGFHSACQRSVSGNCHFGCDSIIVSGARHDGLGDDKMGVLLYAVEKRIGGTSLLVSAALHQRIRVFRLVSTPSSLQSQSKIATATPEKKIKCNMYRYDGLYKVISCAAPACLDDDGTLLFILQMDNWDSKLQANVDPSVDTYERMTVGQQQNQECLHDFYSLAYFDCAAPSLQFKLRTDVLDNALPLRSVVSPIEHEESGATSIPKSKESEIEGIDRNELNMLKNTLKDQLDDIFPQDELEAFRQELDARREEEEKKARERKLLGITSLKKKKTYSKKGHRGKMGRRGIVTSSKFGQASSFNIQLLHVLGTVELAQAQEIMIRSAVQDARSRTYCPALSRAFASKAKVKRCSICERRQQGAHFCRIRHRHSGPDFDGGDSAPYLRYCFSLPDDELNDLIEKDRTLITQLCGKSQSENESNDTTMKSYRSDAKEAPTIEATNALKTAYEDSTCERTTDKRQTSTSGPGRESESASFSTSFPSPVNETNAKPSLFIEEPQRDRSIALSPISQLAKERTSCANGTLKRQKTHCTKAAALHAPNDTEYISLDSSSSKDDEVPKMSIPLSGAEADGPSPKKRRTENSCRLKSTKEAATQRGISRLSKAYVMSLGQLGFAKWGKQYLPTRVVNPFTEGKEQREEWEKARKKARLRGQRRAKALFLVRWYTDHTYSIVPASDFTPWCKANSKMRSFGESSGNGKDHTRGIRKIEAMKEFRKDLELQYKEH